SCLTERCSLHSLCSSLHDALPILEMQMGKPQEWHQAARWVAFWVAIDSTLAAVLLKAVLMTFNRCLGRVDERPRASQRLKVIRTDRKSTRLNSSHGSISYAVFCLK